MWVCEREVYTSQSTSCAEEKNMAFERRVLLILLLLVGVSSNLKKKKKAAMRQIGWVSPELELLD